MEQHIERLSEAQRQIGVEVVNVFNRGQSSVSSAIQLFPGADLGVLRPQALRNAAFYSAAAASTKVRRWAKSGSGPLVVHAHGAWSDFLFARSLGALLRADATVGTIHGKVHRHGMLVPQEPAWRGLDAIFVTGRRDFEAVRRVVGDKAIHLPSAPEEVFGQPALGPPGLEYDIVCVGSLVPVKRIDLVLQCAAQSRSRKFAIIGDGPEYVDLQQQAALLQLQNVTFLGTQTPRQVREVLARSKLFLSTSVEEGTPTAMLEALAAGLPVVMTPSNDYSWIIDDANGLVTKDWSVDEVVRSFERILTDLQYLSPTVLEANHARMKSISWAANAAKVTRTMLDCAEHAARKALS